MSKYYVSDHDHWFTSQANDYICPLCNCVFDLPIEPVFIDSDREKEIEYDE